MGNNESAAILAATASHAVGLQTHGIVSIRHGGTMLFKVVASTGAFNAGALVEWVRQTTGSLMVEDVYNAALSVGFGSKEDLVVQEAGGTKAFDESLEPDARFDDFRLFLDPWRHPQVDAEEGFVLGGLQDSRPQTARIEFAHAVRHCPLARKHNAPGGRHYGRIGGHDYRLAAGDVLQRLRHRTQITHAVVDDGNGVACAHSVPFVDGMAPAMRGSGVTAMRKARPKALKMVSA